MTRVYLLWFVPTDEHGDDDDGNTLLIGVYDSRRNAEAAIERLRSKPGFAEQSERFQIHDRVLNEDSWTDGFIED